MMFMFALACDLETMSGERDVSEYVVRRELCSLGAYACAIDLRDKKNGPGQSPDKSALGSYDDG